ncbi:MAG: hypothetical protein MUF54_07640 [Polyangiaceae bacterium]|jgi:hypothetical protein|nr:hypothetical protein [Polyangiaceae bacterium]
MGNIVPRSAAADTIIEHYDSALAKARAREELVRAPAEVRLGSLEPAIRLVQTTLQGAESAADAATAKLLASDLDSDNAIGATLDEIWNALGRPAQSIDYSLIAGTGKAQWTDGDPIEQHLLMKVLATNIRATNAPTLQQTKETWAARIEAKAAAQEAASTETRGADVTVFAARAQQRGLANLAQVAISRLKRDYKNLGLTESQIHEIIPDYQSRRRAKLPTPPAPPT